LQGGAIGGEVDSGGEGGEGVELAAGVVVAFFERGEGGGGLAFEAEGGGDAVPVDFEGCGGALFLGVGLVRVGLRAGWWER